MSFLKERIRGIEVSLRRATYGRGRPRILFDIANPIVEHYAVPVIRELLRRGHSVAVTGFRPEHRVDGRPLHAVPEFSTLFVPVCRAGWIPWRTIVLSDYPSTGYHWVAPRVFLDHGGAVGNIGKSFALRLRSEGITSHLLTLSDPSAALLQETDPTLVLGKTLFVGGSPKVDALLGWPESRESVLARLGLPAEQRCVLLTSHWRDQGLLPRFGSAILRALLEVGNVSVIVTGHFHLWHAQRGRLPPGWDEELANLLAQFPQLRFAPWEDARPLLVAADVIIGDASSIVIEASVLHKPLVVLGQALRGYSDTTARDLLGMSADVFHDAADLPRVIRSVLARGCTIDHEQRARLTEHAFGNLGRSAAALASAIERIVAAPDGQ